MFRFTVKLLKDERGVTAIKVVFFAILITIAAIVAMDVLRTSLKDLF